MKKAKCSLFEFKNHFTHIGGRKSLLIFLFFLSFTAFTPIYAIDLIWVGGFPDPNADFEWNDNRNWKFASSGNVANTAPTSQDNVLFDHTGDYTQDIVLNEDHLCGNFEWNLGTYSGPLPRVEFNSGGSLTVNGFFNVPQNTDIDLYSHAGFHLIFSGAGASVRDVSFNGNQINCDVTFSEDNVQWNFTEDVVITQALTLTQGSLNFDGNNVTVRQFLSYYTTLNRVLDISGSTFTITANKSPYSLNGTNFTYINNNSQIIFTTTSHVIISHNNVPMSYDNIYINGANATLTGTLTIDELRFNNACYLSGENTIENLILENGAKLTIYPTDTQKVTNLITTGSCAAFNQIQSLWSGRNAIIKTTNSGGNYSLNSLYVEDVELNTDDGAPTYAIGTNGFYNLTSSSSSGWTTSSSLTGQTFNWQGDASGNGDWSDPANWLIGSSATTCLPSPIDDVVFGTSTGTVTLNEPISHCKSMDWQNAPTGAGLATSSEFNELDIYGSMTLASNLDFTFDGDMNFRSHDNTVVQTVDAGSNVLNANLIFNGSDGSWELPVGVDLETTNDIIVNGGTFTTNGNTVEAYKFASEYSTPREIDISGSTINVERWYIEYLINPVSRLVALHIPDPDLTFIAGNSTINIGANTSTPINNFSMGMAHGLTYHNVNLNNASQYVTLSVSNCTFDTLNLQGNTRIGSNTPVGVRIEDELTLAAGSSYEFLNENFIEANGNLNAVGNCNNYINIEGGSFSSNNASPMNVDFCIITDNVINSGTFIADNSIVDPNSGWTIGSSDPSRDLHFYASASDDSWNLASNWYLDYSIDAGTGVETYSNPQSCPPGPRDNVFFHSSSFDSLTSPSISLLENQTYCLGMIWLDAPQGKSYPATPVEFLGSTAVGNDNVQNLVIFGELVLQDSDVIDWQFNGDVEFKYNEESDANRVLDAKDIVFHRNLLIDIYSDNEPSSSITLLNDLEVEDVISNSVDYGDIVLESGIFTTDGWDVSCDVFQFSGNNIKTLDASRSVASQTEMNFRWLIETTRGTNIQALNTTITFDETILNCIADIYSNDVDYTNAVVNMTNTTYRGAIVGSDNSFGRVNFSGDGLFGGDNEFEVLNLNAGSTYTLQNNSEQFISDGGRIEISNTSANRTVIRSEENPEIATITSEEFFCLDFIELIGIEATPVPTFDANGNPNGTVTLVAGANSINQINNDGWSFAECEPEVIEGCSGEAINFEGVPNNCNSVWTFGDGSPAVMENSPSHLFTTPGTYNVVLTFETPCLTGQTGSESKDSRNYTVIINQSCCDTEDYPNHTFVSGSITSNTVWNDQIFVEGNITVEQGAKLDINNSDVVFSDGVSIRLYENSTIAINNSTLRPCDVNGLWNGIQFVDASSGKINNSVIFNGNPAIRLSTTGTVDIVGNQFTNCITGIYADQGSGSTELEHVISANDFNLNRDNAYLLSAPTVVFRGIQLVDVLMKNSISLNEFNYNYTVPEGRDLIGYGIQLTSSSATVSDNTFLNVSYGYSQHQNEGVCSFDHNTITYNNAYEFSSANPITLSDVNNLTTISGNTIRSSSPILGSGIHFSNGNNLVIDGNTIEKFGFGLYAQNSEVLEITNNEFTDIASYGLFLRDCYESTKITKNVIDLSGGRGMRLVFDEDNTTSSIEITNNCILNNAGYTIELISSIECLSLPVIENNYLYNYGGGIRIENMEGSLGASGNPAGNSFISNSNGIDLNYTSSCTITSYGNWPQLLKGPSATTYDQIDPKSSTTSCGRQVASLRKINVTDQYYLKEVYGLNFLNERADYSIETFQKIQQTGEAFTHSQVVVRTLLLNDDAVAANNFLTEAKLQFNLSNQESAWLAYLIAKKEMNWMEAETQLNLAVGVEGLNSGDLELEQLKVEVFSTGRTIAEINSAEKQRLYQIYNESDNVHARAVIHVLDKDHPFIYEMIDIDPGILPLFTSIGQEREELTLYPNPTNGELNLHLKVMPNENSEVAIVDMYGRVLRSQTIPAMQNKLRLDLNDLKSGMYYLKLKNDRGEFQSSFQVIK